MKTETALIKVGYRVIGPGEGRVTIELDDQRLELPTKDARIIAMAMMDSAAIAETEAHLIGYIREALDTEISPEHARSMVADFREYRHEKEQHSYFPTPSVKQGDN